MLKIKPIQSKDEQERLAALCGIPYDLDCLAYAAHEDDRFLGMSQFRLTDTAGVIRNLRLVPGLDDFEAAFIMGRATMNFIDLCGVHACVCPDDAADHRLLTAIGFRKDEDGVWRADLTHQFDGHCCEHRKDSPSRDK